MTELTTEPIESYGLQKQSKHSTLISKVGIVGCGTVGQNLATMASSLGMDVVFIELNEDKIKSALKSIENELDRQISHWGMTGSEKRIILSRIQGSAEYDDLSGCDLVIEATITKCKDPSIEARKNVFKNIEKHVSLNTIIATNATTIPLTDLFADLEHKERCLCLHFLTSSPNSTAVEVVKGLYTSNATYEAAISFCKMMEKTVIPVEESAGLISIRLLSVLVNEACAILSEGISVKSDIDITMKEGFGLAYGPLEMSDRVGLDKVERWMENLYLEFGDLKYKPSPILKKLVRANQLGKKTNKGFFEYDESGKKIPTTINY